VSQESLGKTREMTVTLCTRKTAST